MLELTTFSIAARCRRTGMLGVAVSTAVPGVGGLCPFVAAGIGAIATQAWVNPYLGIDGLELLRQGLSAADALDRLIAADPGRDTRQLGIVDAQGRTAAHTGSGCTAWAGHVVGDGFTIQGNMLTGAETVAAMADSARASEAEPLFDRLMLALEAGQAAGGDYRGRQSAALKVFHREAYPYLELRVDEHAQPVAELRRVLEVARLQLLPFIDGLPSRTDAMRQLPEAVVAMLLTSPAQRPGGTGP